MYNFGMHTFSFTGCSAKLDMLMILAGYRCGDVKCSKYTCSFLIIIKDLSACGIFLFVLEYH